MTLILNKLSPDAIDEKIALNEKLGTDIYKLRNEIMEEQKDFIWMKIRAEVQIQFFAEQLIHINQRIKQIEEKAVQSIKG